MPAGVKYSEVLQATGGSLHVSGGWAVMQMIEALDRGVHALMPMGMHELYVHIDRQHLDISIRFFKRLLWRQGIYARPRAPARRTRMRRSAHSHSAAGARWISTPSLKALSLKR